MKKTLGFTLIEVLIALFIVGVALPALVMRVQSILGHGAYIKEKTYAYWIAENKIQEVMLTQSMGAQAVKVTKENDTVEYGGSEWAWKMEIKATEAENIFRIDVSVGQGEDNWLANLSGYIYE